jgi:hypothetical protein
LLPTLLSSNSSFIVTLSPLSLLDTPIHNKPASQEILHFLPISTSIANRAPIFSLSTTMKSAIAIAAASAALANAVATPVQVAARAETSSATSSGSVPQVSVKGNGT